MKFSKVLLSLLLINYSQASESDYVGPYDTCTLVGQALFRGCTLTDKSAQEQIQQGFKDVDNSLQYWETKNEEGLLNDNIQVPRNNIIPYATDQYINLVKNNYIHAFNSNIELFVNMLNTTASIVQYKNDKTFRKAMYELSSYSNKLLYSDDLEVKNYQKQLNGISHHYDSLTYSIIQKIYNGNPMHDYQLYLDTYRNIIPYNVKYMVDQMDLSRSISNTNSNFIKMFMNPQKNVMCNLFIGALKLIFPPVLEAKSDVFPSIDQQIQDINTWINNEGITYKFDTKKLKDVYKMKYMQNRLLQFLTIQEIYNTVVVNHNCESLQHEFPVIFKFRQYLNLKKLMRNECSYNKLNYLNEPIDQLRFLDNLIYTIDNSNSDIYLKYFSINYKLIELLQSYLLGVSNYYAKLSSNTLTVKFSWKPLPIEKEIVEIIASKITNKVKPQAKSKYKHHRNRSSGV